ncbi:hypothetical protein JW998_10990 [candidate division KSB1 bacterium]|nr:hypothetical protein [candidate division KSB1 bacterium]
MAKARKKKPAQLPQQLAPAKKRLFTLIAVSFPFLVIILLEIGLRLGHYGGDTRLFVPTPTKESPYFGLNQNAGRRFFYRDDFLPSPRKDLFLQIKPENGFRIFVLGGSTTAGFPYGNNLTFTRILQRRLISIFPEKHIEVVNCAFTAINSYTMLDYMDEILAQQPDLILIYAGHNEFYGALGVSSMESLGRDRWFVKSYLRLQRLKIFIWIRDIVNAVRSKHQPSRDSLANADPTRTVMSRIVKDKNIPYGSSTYAKGVAQFRGNLRDILAQARKRDVPVILSELVSNVRDSRPFVSVATDKYPALSEFNAARAAEEQSDFAMAKEHYYRAKDYDALRFRAAEDFNAVIHELAVTFKLPVVPMKAFFEQASPHGLIGDNLMWEHLHPRSSGYFIMADAFLQSMRDNGHIIPDWSARKVLPGAAFEREWGLTKMDSVYAGMVIMHLKGSWPFVQDGPNRFMTQFVPRNREEELAFRVLRDGEGTLEQAHLQLAAEYEKRGDFVNAYKEYAALIYTVPTLELFYEPMIQLLLKIEKYELALQILFDAMHYQDSAFVHKWIGQIYLVLDETERGIQYLQNAVQREPNDDQAVYNITRAYYRIGRFDEGDKRLARLREHIGNTQEFRQLEEFRQLMVTEQQMKGE